jgi:TonB family protein
VASPAEGALASLQLGPTFGTEALAEAGVESASPPADERLPELPPSEETPEPGPESAPDPELDEPGESRAQEPVNLEDAPEAHAEETPEAGSALAPTSPAPVLDEIPTPELVSRSTGTEARDVVALETSLPPISARARGEIPRTTSGSPRTSVVAAAGPASTTGVPRADRPLFGPVEVAPEIRNRAQIQRVLEREYPSLLRMAGVGGTVRIHFLVDDAGEVAEARVVGSSGHLQLDAAALRVAQRFEFAPALSQDGRVPVWIELPITFQAAQ